MPRRDRPDRRPPTQQAPPPIAVPAAEPTGPAVQASPGELPKPALEQAPIMPPLAPPKPAWKQEIGQEEAVAPTEAAVPVPEAAAALAPPVVEPVEPAATAAEAVPAVEATPAPEAAPEPTPAPEGGEEPEKKEE